MIYIDLFLTRSSLFWVILEIFLQTLRTRPKFVGIYVIYEYLFIYMCIYTIIDISLNIHNSKISRTDSYMKYRKNWCTKNIFKGSRLQISLINYFMTEAANIKKPFAPQINGLVSI